ncbi:MAG: transcription termination factor NusA [Candidatus Taylorbacteria bacterium RIFCSPLOWO2_02_FULL_43_11]|uniref:Transcription termination/antitermination protein NusA n=1 Tax=Candidatus Taylorbacteria bacterium RIFCSPHIGHO2_02_FULL_43_32b TaxID=1802306 RepID=A0A1G2MGF6_9BACT|nr:MAG: transcription termination factor NusA [Candidatus Taylorbacteria bacterium RIFCSPHIGHO2_01_FULL_43_47]OHA22986.1 MAG: transcription termination factor NusA [Candidatus Taylorbacteria bacterium RIFCSPHIGHO2_02_FULL_43_32b]OHA29900.1 MAG: transcription termination factor NusA [Candidatus Taylorbacteria bacterium RIFCSPLOWO2_01_FULL_43_44]OHA36172.1 MAG: transcription termination factor NusA [Candidatus Taylorbacteria bacterium RIFCSPLOWO2_02_FULL_43_11]
MLFDLKVINSVLDQLEEERGIPRSRVLEAIEAAIATAYKKEYGKKGQIVRAKFDVSSGATEFYQVKIVVDDTKVIVKEEGEEIERAPEDDRIFYNPEHHILIEDARKIKKDAVLEDEIIFPLENKGDFGRIAAQTAKQVIIQKIREAEKLSVVAEYGQREGEIVSGTVQRVERGNIFVDMGRATGILPFEEQIPGEHFRQGERVRAYLFRVEESPRGVFLKLSRSHPKFIYELFKIEAPEVSNGVVEIKAIAREPGSRSKVAVFSNDEHIDPVGSLVGQRGVRVSTVMSELGGEKIDIIEWSAESSKFIADSVSPAKALEVKVDENEHKATVIVSEDQQSLAIGKGGQNVRLAAKLTGWKIDIRSVQGETVAEADGQSEDAPVVIKTEPKEKDESETKEVSETVTEAKTETIPQSDKEKSAPEKKS